MDERDPSPVVLYYIDGVPAWQVRVQNPAVFKGVRSTIQFRAFSFPQGAVVACLYRLYDLPDRPYFFHRALNPAHPDTALYLERTREKRLWVVEFLDEKGGKEQGHTRLISMEGSGFAEVHESALAYNRSLGEALQGHQALDRFVGLFYGPSQEKGPEAAWEEVARACDRRAPGIQPRLTLASRFVEYLADDEARGAGFPEIAPEHLWMGLCKLTDLPASDVSADPNLPSEDRRSILADLERLVQWFKGHGLDPAPLRRALRRRLGKGAAAPEEGREIPLSPAAEKALERASLIAELEGFSKVDPVHLGRALLEDPPPALAEILSKAGHAAPPKPAAAPVEVPTRPLPEKPLGGLLGQIGRNLTALARAGKLDKVIGRKEEIRRLAQVLTQRRKSNAILVGDAGVGKTCIVEGLAQKIASPSCPEEFRGKEIVEIPMAALVAGTKYRGEFEQKVEQLLREAEENPHVILFIDEVHTVLGAGTAEGAPLDAANIFKPALGRGRIQMVGATTTEEYERYITRDPAFARRFDVVWVEEPSREEALEMLKGLRPGFEAHHRLSIVDEALESAVDLSMRFLPERRLPDKALDLVDQACAQTALKSLSGRASGGRFAPGPVDREAVARVVAQRCRVPLEMLLLSEAERLKDLEGYLGGRVLGQDEAVRAVASSIRAAVTVLRDPRRPLASFLFVGPSGVGKTELARALSEFLFLDARRLIQLDMSEFMEPQAISRLIGTSPGYVGHGEEGQLTGAIRRSPFAVVVFDEIEKAHPDVLNVLLQLLDEGRVTDGRGRAASFREAVVILTSNLGAGEGSGPGSPIGFRRPGSEPPGGDVRAPFVKAVEAHLRPELRSRIAKTVVFLALGLEVLEKIVEKRVEGVSKRLSRQGIVVGLTPEARRILAAMAYDPRYGAREVERVVEREVVQPIAEALLRRDLVQGGNVMVIAHEDRIGMTFLSPPRPGRDRMDLT